MSARSRSIVLPIVTASCLLILIPICMLCKLGPRASLMAFRTKFHKQTHRSERYDFVTIHEQDKRRVCECTGEGHGGCGCGAFVLVEPEEIFETALPSDGEWTSYVFTFQCRKCAAWTDRSDIECGLKTRSRRRSQ